jgi:hypothetical protein
VQQGVPYVATLDDVIASRGGIPWLRTARLSALSVVPAGLARRTKRSAKPRQLRSTRLSKSSPRFDGPTPPSMRGRQYLRLQEAAKTSAVIVPLASIPAVPPNSEYGSDRRQARKALAHASLVTSTHGNFYGISYEVHLRERVRKFAHTCVAISPTPGNEPAWHRFFGQFVQKLRGGAPAHGAQNG